MAAITPAMTARKRTSASHSLTTRFSCSHSLLYFRICNTTAVAHQCSPLASGGGEGSCAIRPECWRVGNDCEGCAVAAGFRKRYGYIIPPYDTCLDFQWVRGGGAAGRVNAAGLVIVQSPHRHRGRSPVNQATII